MFFFLHLLSKLVGYSKAGFPGLRPGKPGNFFLQSLKKNVWKIMKNGPMSQKKLSYPGKLRMTQTILFCVDTFSVSVLPNMCINFFF